MSITRVLLIDDEVAFTRALSLNLERGARYEVRSAASGESGVLLARTFQPDVILLDVMLPDMDGGDVAARLRECPSLESVPIVFMTAMIRRDELCGTLHDGGSHRVLPKPSAIEEIISAIEACLV